MEFGLAWWSISLHALVTSIGFYSYWKSCPSKLRRFLLAMATCNLSMLMVVSDSMVTLCGDGLCSVRVHNHNLFYSV